MGEGRGDEGGEAGAARAENLAKVRAKDLTDLQRKLKNLRGDPRFFYQPHAKQREFHHAGGPQGGGCRERLFLAGNRVGKTLAGAAEVAFHLTGLYPHWWTGKRFDRPVRAWAASVSREATRDILQVAYLGEGGGTPGVIPSRLVLETVRKSGVAGAVDTVKVRHASGGESVLGFKSYDQGRAKFQGTAREVVHLDEEPMIEIYEECLLRTLTADGGHGGLMLLTMTPLSGLTEMVRHFVENERGDGKYVVRAGWADAAFLDAQETQRLRASLRPFEVAAREFGTPQLGRGLVFPVEESGVSCARFEVPKDWKQCFGLDFGWSNPTAAVWLAHDAVNDVVYVTDCYSRSEATPAEHCEEIGRRGAWIPGVCDPAGQAANARDGSSLISLYEKNGLRLDLANNDVEGGLMAMLERLRAGKLKVFADLHAWWHEFRHYSRDAKGKIVKRDDHLLDATRYALMSGLGLARAEKPIVAVRPRSEWWQA